MSKHANVRTWITSTVEVDLLIAAKKLEDHAMRFPIANGAYATLGGSTPNRNTTPGSRAAGSSKDCLCLEPSQPAHLWMAMTCGRLRCAITGDVYAPRGKIDKALTVGQRQQILNTLHKPRYAELLAALGKKHKTILKKAPAVKGSSEKDAGPAYPTGGVVAALIDPALLLPMSSGVYAAMEFDAHPLSNSTILDNGAALHLVNTEGLLVPSTWQEELPAGDC